MQEKTFLSVEDTIVKLDEIFNTIEPTDLNSKLMIHNAFENFNKIESNTDSKNSLTLLSNILSMRLNLGNRNDPFVSSISYNGYRSFSPNDFTEEDMVYLSNLVTSISQPLLKAIIADVLWTYSFSKNLDFLDIAINSYISLNTIENQFSKDIYDFWHRAAILATSSRNSDLIEQVRAKLISEFEIAKPYWDFHRIALSQIILESKLDKSLFDFLANKLLEEGKQSKKFEFNVLEQSLSLSAKIYKVSKNLDKQFEAVNELANLMESHGDELNSISSNFFYKQALQTYRSIPNQYREKYSIEDSLARIQQKISNSGIQVIDSLELVSVGNINIESLTKQSESHVKGKDNLVLALLYFSGITKVNFEEIIKTNTHLLNTTLIGTLFPMSTISQDGRTIANIEIMNDENKDEVIFKHSIRNFLNHIQLVVQACILPAIEQIQSEFTISREFLLDFCKASNIVPEGREILISEALYAGFEHNFRTSVYLLAPQMENIIRILLKNKGIVTTRTDKEGIEHEVGLSTLVDSDGARGILGDDLWFELQAVFTSSLGPNLRNEVGHGLLDDNHSNSMASVYAWWMLLRLVAKGILADS